MLQLVGLMWDAPLANTCETVEKPHFYDLADRNLLILQLAKLLESTILHLFDRLSIVYENTKTQRLQLYT